MSCKPHDLLGLAKRLAELPTDTSDAVMRSVISRAYYASLHIVDASFDAFALIQAANESSHQKIIERAASYGRSLQPGRTVAGKIAKFAHKLRVERNKADYELALDIRSSKVSDALASAEQIFSWCEEIKNKRAA